MQRISCPFLAAPALCDHWWKHPRTLYSDILLPAAGDGWIRLRSMMTPSIYLRLVCIGLRLVEGLIGHDR